MMSKMNKTIPILSVLLLFAMLGGPQMLAAAQQEPVPVQDQRAPQTGTTPTTGTTRPPVEDQRAPQGDTAATSGTTQPPSTTLPDAPSTQAQDQSPAQNQDQANGAQPANTQQQRNKKDQNPLGAAAAETGPTAGGAASRPAGMAIAPPKQRQVRSLLLKLGAIAAGGAAIGAVVALTKGTGSKPPGAP